LKLRSHYRAKASLDIFCSAKTTVQAVQYVQTVQVVESFEDSENGTVAMFPHEIGLEDLELHLNRSAKSWRI
jgi:hypothetical protein